MEGGGREAEGRDLERGSGRYEGKEGDRAVCKFFAVVQLLSETQSGGVVEGEELDPSVSGLVQYVWREAAGELEEVLAVPVGRVKLEQVDKAEGALLAVKRLLDNGADPNGVGE